MVGQLEGLIGFWYLMDGGTYLDEVSQQTLPKDVSNHFIVILKYANQVWSPKPFELNNHQLSHCILSELAHSTWKAFFYFGEFKIYKIGFKNWNRRVCGSLDSQIDSLKEVVSNLDSLLDLMTLSDEKIQFIFEEIMDIWSLLRIKYSQLF